MEGETSCYLQSQALIEDDNIFSFFLPHLATNNKEREGEKGKEKERMNFSFAVASRTDASRPELVSILCLVVLIIKYPTTTTSLCHSNMTISLASSLEIPSRGTFDELTDLIEPSFPLRGNPIG